MTTILFDLFGTLVSYSASRTEQGYPRAAAVLAEAIAVDPTQAADARGDIDFQPYLDHPAFARLLGPGAT